MATSERTRFLRLVAGIIGALALIGIALGFALSFGGSGGRAGGDPGGRILATLLATGKAVPSETSSQVTIAKDATWISSCSDKSLRPGWSPVQAQITFASTMPVDQIEGTMIENLGRQGWTFENRATPSTVYAPSNNGARTLVSLHVVTFGKSLSTGQHATLTLNSDVPLPGDVINQDTNVTLVAGSPPMPPIGSCSDG
jgi:hypothetical protein